MSAVYKTMTKMAAICDIFVFATGQLGRLLRTLRCDREEVNPEILGRFRRSFLQQGIASFRAVRYRVSIYIYAGHVCDVNVRHASDNYVICHYNTNILISFER